MKKFSIIASIVVIILILQSCATFMQGTRTNPSDVVVTVNGQEKGGTPLIVDLKGKVKYTIQIKLDEYENYKTTITRKVNGWVRGDIFFGRLVGLAVDIVSGGLYKLTPKQISTSLKESDMSPINTEEGLYITVVTEPKNNWQKIGTLKSVK